MNVKLASQDLLETKGILDQAKIKFWLNFGTLLGAIRDGSLISYDHDIDLRILARSWKPSLYKVFQKRQFRCGITRPQWQHALCPKLIKYIQLRKRTNIPIILAIAYYYAPKKAYVTFPHPSTATRCMALTPRIYYDTDQFMEFLGASFRVPVNPEKYLSRIYYGDWSKPSNDSKYYARGRKKISLIPYLKWFAQHPDYIKLRDN